MPSKAQLRRLEAAEVEAGVCLCKGPPIISFARVGRDEPEDVDEGQECPTHPGQRQRVVIFTYSLDAGTPCECGTCWACTRGLANAQATGQGVQRPDRALPSSSERYLDSQRDGNGASESVTEPPGSMEPRGLQAPQTPRDVQDASDMPAYQPDSPHRSPPAHGPPLSLPGPARGEVIELGRQTRREHDPLDRLDPSMLPDCAACSHLASWHSEFRLGGTGCMVAAEIGGSDGPCTCIAYNGPPPPRLPMRVDQMRLPGCVCQQYFGYCICGAASDFQQSNPRSPQ